MVCACVTAASEADGPTVLLLHGWPQSPAMLGGGSCRRWRRPDYFPLVPDLRGCGDSDKPIGGYDAADTHGRYAFLGRPRWE